MFIKTDSVTNHTIYLVIYVDDILVCSPNESLVLAIKTYLGPVRYFLSIEIAKSEKGLIPHSRKVHIRYDLLCMD